MNKDALLATLIGFGIGLLITGVLLAGPNLIKLLPPIRLPNFSFSISQNQVQAPTPTPKTAGFSVESPLPEAIENSADLLVSGTASQGATILIAGPSDESAVVVGNDGRFAGKVTLLEGKNDISITSLFNTKIETQKVTVYFTEEAL